MNIKIHSRRAMSPINAEVERESDTSLVVLTTYVNGYRSAHRDYAAKVFGTHSLWCINRLTWINKHGIRVVMTRWNTQEFRTK